MVYFAVGLLNPSTADAVPLFLRKPAHPRHFVTLPLTEGITFQGRQGIAGKADEGERLRPQSTDRKTRRSEILRVCFIVL